VEEEVMHLKFKTVRWKNLLSTGNAWTEIVLDKAPTTLIYGINGSGKSTLLEAVSLALFGKPFRNCRKNELVNSINKKDCVAEIEFEVGAKPYKVVRGILPNIFEVWSDGLMLHQTRESKDLQAYLEKFIIGMNQKTFNQIVIAGRAQWTPFMQAPAADRRNFIEDLLDIQIFSTMSTLAKAKVSDNKNEIDKLKITIDAKAEKRDMIMVNMEEFERDNDTKIRQLEKENRELTLKQHGVKTLLNNYELEITKFNALLVDENKFQTKLLKMRQMKTKIETNRENYNQKHDFLDKHEDCPTCKQKIAEEFKIDEQCRIDLKLVELDKGLHEISGEIKQLEEKMEEYALARRGLNEAKQHNAVALGESKSIKATIERNAKTIDDLKAGPGIIGTLKTDLTKVMDEIDDLAIKTKEALDQRQVLTTAVDMLKDGGIKTRIIKQYIPVINQTVNKYLRSLNFLAKFELDERFNETIKSRYLDEFSYGNFSEGEKMRIDLSLMLTWRSIAKARNSSSANILILDEVFDGSLDDAGIEDFVKIMQGLSADSHVLVISHKQEQMIDKFARTLKAAKKKNFSTIMEI
jgi:DNA repair exonuclease SbcCD ATPase subunit